MPNLGRLPALRSSISLLFLATVLPAFAGGNMTPPELKPYRMVYVAKYNGVPIEAVRELSATAGGYRIESRATNLIGKIIEIEDFTVDTSGQLQPLSYRYDRSIFGVKRKEALDIDRSQGIASYERKGEIRQIPLEGHFLGPVSYQEQLRHDVARQAQDLSYRVIIRGSVNDYAFERLGEEQLDTAIGTLRAVKLRRLREADNPRETLIWLAPDLDYRLVKLLQVEEDGERYEMLLKHSVPPLPASIPARAALVVDKAAQQ